MGYESDVIKEFDVYCRKKREEISNIEDSEQKARQEKVLVARSLLHRAASAMNMSYAKYTAVISDNDEPVEHRIKEIDESLQSAMLQLISAGLEDTSFNKWKSNLDDAVYQLQSNEQAKRLPRFLKSCDKIADSLDIDFTDIEDELRIIFEPECIYNTLVLAVTAVKMYSEILESFYEKKCKSM